MFSKIITYGVVFLCSFGSILSYKGLYTEDDDLLVLDNDNFNRTVYGSSNVWIIEFYSSWCGHCIHFAPKWKEFSTSMAGKVLDCYIN